MNTAPRNRNEWIDALRHAMADADTDRKGPTALEEEVGLVLEGRLDELPPADRTRVLRAAIHDPETAELLASGHRLGLAGETRPRRSEGSRFRRVITIGWAVAASLLLMLGVWRLADPPEATPSGPDIRLQSTDPTRSDDAEQYWQQAEKQRAMEQLRTDRLRDYALLASAVACLLLSLALAWKTIRRSPDAPPRKLPKPSTGSSSTDT